MNRKLQIAVFGSDEDHCEERTKGIAEQIGSEIGKAGHVLMTGGMGGVMHYTSKGAHESGGQVVGILPTDNRKEVNPFCDILVSTGIGYMRGHILANSADTSIVVNGGIGSRQEAESSYWNFVPIIALANSGGIAQEIAGKYLDERFLTKVVAAQTPFEAVTKAIELGENRLALQKRLEEVGLDLGIYRKKPSKFIRINPRNPIKPEELKIRLEEDYGIKTEFKETGVEGILESTNQNIGGWINGQRNELFNEKYFIQDLASVICVGELGLQRGSSLLETCAARGFKSILANDMMGGDLEITALDIDEDKFGVMEKFFKKFRIKSMTKLTDATTYNGKQHNYVLVDAPCSSEGMNVVYDSTLQKDVSGFDSAIRFSDQDVRELARLQARLLQNGFNHLTKGGTLIYATCTLNRRENEEVVEGFLKDNPDAISVNVDMERYGVKHTQSDLGVRILPEKTKGFYFAKFKKA